MRMEIRLGRATQAMNRPFARCNSVDDRRSQIAYGMPEAKNLQPPGRGGKEGYMKHSEVIEKYWNKIKEAMENAYANCIGGRTQEKIYIWEDGEIATLFGVYGDNSFLVPNEFEERELYYITTVSTSDPRDFITDDIDEMSEEEYDRAYEEASEWLIDGYDSDEELSNVYDQARYAERMEED